MARNSDVPEFGPLAGVKVLSTGSGIAQPYAAMLLGESGANVIHVENALVPDPGRTMKYWFQQEHRNQRGMALDICSMEGKEIFLKLIEWADIWMESSKGGTYEKWCLTDETLWERNPKLVIVHISGYGQTGVGEYVNRASWDPVGQAFSGQMYLNGLPEPNPPMLINPVVCDYVTALNATWAALAALHNAEKTGKGDSIDVSQFESLFKMQGAYPMMFFNDGYQYQRRGNFNPQVAGMGVWKSKDERYVSILIGGAGPLKRALPMLGLAGDTDFPEGIQMARVGSPAGAKLNQALTDFCAVHTGDELQKIFSENQIPAQLVYDYKMISEDPHYAARNDIVEWEDFQYGKVKGVGLGPKFKHNPGQIWRSAPLYGMDNEDILMDLGCDDPGFFKHLYEKKVLNKKVG
jgi:crotonobetainyl-CoA:carnitine CoA-transferase CaiB-like acyl-CoA transferase